MCLGSDSVCQESGRHLWLSLAYNKADMDTEQRLGIKITSFDEKELSRKYVSWKFINNLKYQLGCSVCLFQMICLCFVCLSSTPFISLVSQLHEEYCPLWFEKSRICIAMVMWLYVIIWGIFTKSILTWSQICYTFCPCVIWKICFITFSACILWQLYANQSGHRWMKCTDLLIYLNTFPNLLSV